MPRPATGAWGYMLHNARSATQARPQVKLTIDTLTVHSDDGTAYTVTVNVTGTNDAAAEDGPVGDDHRAPGAGGEDNATPGDRRVGLYAAQRPIGDPGAAPGQADHRHAHRPLRRRHRLHGDGQCDRDQRC